jgi:hypothetical protein
VKPELIVSVFHRYWLACAVAALTALASDPAVAAQPEPFALNEREPAGRWAVTAFGGRMTDETWFDIFYQPANVSIAPVSLAGIGVSYRFARFFGGLNFGIEGQAVRYFGDQDNWDFNLPLVMRWDRFPWNGRVFTSAAFGIGLSGATEVPKHEAVESEGSEQLMTYWMIELEAGPQDSKWSGIARLHHRSVAFGTFGESGGANSLVLGIRRKF